MEVLDTFLDAMGDTPLVRLHTVTRGVRPAVLAKLEMLNPGGSVKDRIGIRMIESAERAGLLKPGGTIVEPTSGNTGHGLAIAAAIRGYKCIFVMPDKMSQEKIALLRAYGAEVVICPTAVPPESPESYYRVADRLAEEIPGAYPAEPVLQPGEPRDALRDDRPRDLATDRRCDRRVRGRGRDGRHDHRRRALPQGAEPGGHDRRSRPRGIRVLGRRAAALPGRGHRRGLLARDVRPVGGGPLRQGVATATRSGRRAPSRGRRGS